jgi:hypothetical protein
VWFDGLSEGSLFQSSVYGKGDGVKVNGLVGALGSELKIVGTHIRGIGASSVGVHVAGAFGGFACDGYTSIDQANVNILVDTSAAAVGNREVFLNPGCSTDSAATDNVQVNDALTTGGTLNILGWNSAAGRYGINVINWHTGWITISDGPTQNAISDNIRLSDPSANYIFGAERNTGSGGWGVNCTVAIAQVFTQPGPRISDNTSGGFATNCSPNTTLPGSTTISIAGQTTLSGDLSFTKGADVSLSTSDAFNLGLYPASTSGTAGKGVIINAFAGGWKKMLQTYNAASGLPTITFAGDGGNTVVGGPLVLESVVINMGYVVTTPSSGGTVTYAATQELAIANPAATLAALTLQLPACAAANDGEQRLFKSTQIVTTLTVTAASGSVVGPPVTAAPGTTYMFHCQGAVTLWF